MTPDEERAMAARLLDAARAVRAAHPDRVAMGRVAVGGLPAGGFGADRALHRALTYLRDEMLLVQAGPAGGPGVLDDEIAHTEAVLAGRASD